MGGAWSKAAIVTAGRKPGTKRCSPTALTKNSALGVNGGVGFQVVHGPGENSQFVLGRFLDLVEECVKVESIGAPALTPIPQPRWPTGP
jgi:hypothetical protein